MLQVPAFIISILFCAQSFSENVAPCIHSPLPSGPLIIGGSDGLEECAIVTAPSTVLNFKCGATFGSLASIWHITIYDHIEIVLTSPGQQYSFTTTDFLIAEYVVTIQCGYCVTSQDCSLEIPSFISRPVSIVVIDVPPPRWYFPATVTNLTVLFDWLPPSDLSSITTSGNYLISYRISIKAFLLNSAIPVQFDFVTNDTHLTVRSCELQEGSVIQPYTWSIATVVEGIASDDVRYSRVHHTDIENNFNDFQFNRLYPCTDGDVRLVDGVNCNEGRLELCLSGVWGTVCDNGWDEISSIVVCNSLGIPGVAKPHYYEGRGTGPIHLNDVICSGTESSILDCQYITDHDCSHNEDIGVQCGLPPQCQDGDIRLIFGSPDELLNVGRVEVCNLNVWGTVCDEFFDLADATVACRQLGFPGASLFFGNAVYGEGLGPILLNNIDCLGHEDSLFDCQRSTKHNCVHSDDIGVVCEPQCTKWDVRLVGGATPLQGWVELCVANVWGRLCDPTWTINETTVLCNELTDSGVPHGLLSSNISSSSRVHMRDIQCNGSEANISECNVVYLQSYQDLLSNITVTCTGATAAMDSPFFPLSTDTGLKPFEVLLIGVGILFVFTILNVSIVALASGFVIKKKRQTNTKDKRPSVLSEQSRVTQLSLIPDYTYLTLKGMTNSPTDDTEGVYDTLEKQESPVNDMPQNNLHLRNIATDNHFMAVPSNTPHSNKPDDNHGIHNLESADQLQNIPSSTINKEENSSGIKFYYSSVYNYPSSVVIPSLHDSDSLLQEVLLATSQTAHDDGPVISSDTADCVTKVNLDTHKIPMTPNSAYDVGSARNSHHSEDLKQQLSIDSTSQMESAALSAAIVHVYQNSAEQMLGVGEETNLTINCNSTSDQSVSSVKNPLYQSIF